MRQPVAPTTEFQLRVTAAVPGWTAIFCGAAKDIKEDVVDDTAEDKTAED